MELRLSDQKLDRPGHLLHARARGPMNLDQVLPYDPFLDPLPVIRTKHFLTWWVEHGGAGTAFAPILMLGLTSHRLRYWDHYGSIHYLAYWIA